MYYTILKQRPGGSFPESNTLSHPYRRQRSPSRQKKASFAGYQLYPSLYIHNFLLSAEQILDFQRSAAAIKYSAGKNKTEPDPHVLRLTMSSRSSFAQSSRWRQFEVSAYACPFLSDFSKGRVAKPRVWIGMPTEKSSLLKPSALYRSPRRYA